MEGPRAYALRVRFRQSLDQLARQRLKSPLLLFSSRERLLFLPFNSAFLSF